MKLTILAVGLSVFLVGCAAVTPSVVTVEKMHPIDVPTPPKSFAVKEPSVPTTPDKEWIEVNHLPSKQFWRAYSDGAVVLRPSEWRALMASHNNRDKWIDLMLDRTKKHNSLVQIKSPDVPKEDIKPWWRLW